MPRQRGYSELVEIPTIEGRYDYLVLGGQVGRSTFGFDRWMNQQFYTSRAWKQIRSIVIVRDNGCDLGVEGYEIGGSLLVHHMNPVTPDDLIKGEDWLLDPEYLITTCQLTHNAIHYGDRTLLPRVPVERQPGDTNLW